MQNITRNTIINHLSNTLKNEPSILALWLEGSDAHDRVDKYSDIDIWIDVKDGKELEIFTKIENILSKIGEIDFSHEIKNSDPKIKQKFFHIKYTSKFLIADICIQSHSRKSEFNPTFKDEKVKIMFDKKNVIKFKIGNIKKHQKEISLRIQELQKTFVFFQVWVRKHIERNDFLEALNAYHKKILEPLIEILRIIYEPTKKNFYLKDIYMDIPSCYHKKIETLYKIDSINTIKTNIKKANKLFFDIIDAIKKQ